MYDRQLRLHSFGQNLELNAMVYELILECLSIVPRLFFGSKDQDKEPLVEFAAELASR